MPRHNYREPMKNITVSVGDETYQRACVLAAKKKTTVAALVKRFINGFITAESDFERLKRQEREIRESITAFSASERLSRDEVHDRNALR